MKKKLMIVVVAVVAAFGAWTGLAETVTNVRGMQREKSNLVDIYYDIEATDGGMYSVKVEIEGRTNAVSAASFTGDVGEGVAPGRNRHIVWNAGADWPDKKGDVRAIVTAEREPEKGKPGRGVQLWAGGPYWATKNIGAEKPEDSGYYFWWGDTVGYCPTGNTFGFDFSYNNSTIYTYDKSINQLQSEGWVVNNNGTYVLAPSHDAARAHWGGSWRMPTYQELYDLCYNKCDWTWTTRNGVNGYIVRGQGAYSSNSIFLPSAGAIQGTAFNDGGGAYWSSTYSEWNSEYGQTSWIFWFDTENHGSYTSLCIMGYPIRPVQSPAE